MINNAIEQGLTVEFTVNGRVSAQWAIDTSIRLDESGVDAAISRLPERRQWVLSVGVPSTIPGRALAHATALAKRHNIDVDNPASVVIVTLDELERMAAAPTMPCLVGAAEIAAMLDVSRQRVHQLRAHPQFPAPLAELTMGPLWDQRAVEKFAREWQRKPGRPRSLAAG